MKDTSKKDWKQLTIALIIILAGSLLANAVNTAAVKLMSRMSGLQI